MRPVFLISILLAALASGAAFAQNTALRGKVVDDQSAVLIGASITIKQGERVVTQTQTTSQGTFEAALPPGAYTLEIDAPDFEKLVQPIQVTANMQPSTYTMKLAQVKAEVTVQANANQVELSPDSNLTATVMDKELIEQLPDDSDELLAYI